MSKIHPFSCKKTPQPILIILLNTQRTQRESIRVWEPQTMLYYSFLHPLWLPAQHSPKKALDTKKVCYHMSILIWSHIGSPQYLLLSLQAQKYAQHQPNSWKTTKKSKKPLFSIKSTRNLRIHPFRSTLTGLTTLENSQHHSHSQKHSQRKPVSSKINQNFMNQPVLAKITWNHALRQIVFKGPVAWTGKRPETGPRLQLPPLFGWMNCLQPDQLKPVATASRYSFKIPSKCT